MSVTEFSEQCRLLTERRKLAKIRTLLKKREASASQDVTHNTARHSPETTTPTRTGAGGQGTVAPHATASAQGVIHPNGHGAMVPAPRLDASGERRGENSTRRQFDSDGGGGGSGRERGSAVGCLAGEKENPTRNVPIGVAPVSTDGSGEKNTSSGGGGGPGALGALPNASRNALGIILGWARS